MRILKLIPVYLAFLLPFGTVAQEKPTFDQVNMRSYELYLKGDWKTLIGYGNDAIREGQDFLNLRLRMGYAAFILTNYGEAIRQYEHALGFDSYNATAHYYIYFCRKYLGQDELALAEKPFLAEDLIRSEKLDGNAVMKAGSEVSYKIAATPYRGNPLYAHITATHRLGDRIHMQHAVATYLQQISEPLLTSVTDNNAIRISQAEYYNRTIVNIDRHLQFTGAYHYQHSVFNNFTYRNHLAMLGIRRSGSHATLQADAMFGRLTDASFLQFNITATYHPFGNYNFYGITTASMRTATYTGFNARQVLGVRTAKDLWLEGHATFGPFRNYAESDGLYIYNAIDPTLFKGGATAYLQLSAHIMAQLGYTYEKRESYGGNYTYHQHSITGGLSWKR